jgi:hypothetical protein
MIAKCCKLCNEAIEIESTAFCPKCLEMKNRIRFLIRHHREKVKKFLVENYNTIIELDNETFDRRVKTYQAPKGIHTPERRTRIRRTVQLPQSPKRRKTDLIP